MAGMLWFNGPIPDGDLGFCTLCTMIHKGFFIQTEEVQALANEVNALSLTEHRSVPMKGAGLPGKTQPELAVAMGFNPMIQQAMAAMLGLPPGSVLPPAIVPLCWSHQYGLMVKEGGIVQPATADQMPHERGAVDLGRRRSG